MRAALLVVFVTAMVALAGAALGPGGHAEAQKQPFERGSISGEITHPSGSNPALLVVAFHHDGPVYWTETEFGDAGYTVEGLAPGRYTVVAYPAGGGIASGFGDCARSDAVADCDPYALREVLVFDGDHRTGMDLFAWGAISGYPEMPEVSRTIPRPPDAGTGISTDEGEMLFYLAAALLTVAGVGGFAYASLSIGSRWRT